MARTEVNKTNRLINEKSPYLLQHARNPVDWYPWGEEAFEKAKTEDRPVFLSIGYSTCHWCHVMEKESFEDSEVAVLLNDNFVSVKLDREERPDLDAIYMEACHALTGQGGWPLTIVMTPDKKPFFAGTYFPKDSRYGLPGLVDILPKLSSLWKEERDRVNRAGNELLDIIRETGRPYGTIEDDIPEENLFHDAFKKLASIYDEHYGGFGGSQKFPIPHNLLYLLRYRKRTGEEKALAMVTKTLDNMAAGGIYDQLGYGFHRYSTDPAWLVPHFEKMLYDQALTVIAYLEAFQFTGRQEYAGTAKQVLSYVMRDLLSPEGGFYTAEDADSEGEEGVFYVWSPAEVKEILGREQGDLFCDYYGITEKGNFVPGKSILHKQHDINEFAGKKRLSAVDLQKNLESARQKLLEARALRERPFRDEKIITSWNGLMIAAFARGAKVLQEPYWAGIAAEAADFIQTNMIDPEGRLLRRYREENAAIPAFLDDYAFLVWGLTELYGATLQSKHLHSALLLNDSMLALFGTEKGGLNYAAGTEEDEGIISRQDAQDGAIPSGNSVAAYNLIKLGRITRNPDLEERGKDIIRAFGLNLKQSPTAYTFLLSALDYAHGPAEETVIAGEKESPEFKALCAVAQKGFRPHSTLVLNPFGDEGSEIRSLCPFLRDMGANGKPAAAYVCRNRTCLPPVTDKEQLERIMD